MPAPKPNATVCGVPVYIGKPISYGGGHIAPTARHLGQYASISKPGAKRLMDALFGHTRLPRPGYEVKLCEDQYLSSMSGSMQIERRASGDFRGVRRRKRS
jgi:hypothetical protein